MVLVTIAETKVTRRAGAKPSLINNPLRQTLHGQVLVSLESQSTHGYSTP